MPGKIPNVKILDFDHVHGDKDGEVSHLAASPVKLPRLLAEMEKCEIRCVNCHRRRTYASLRTWRARWAHDRS